MKPGVNDSNVWCFSAYILNVHMLVYMKNRHVNSYVVKYKKIQRQIYLISNSIFCFSSTHHAEWLISSSLLKESIVSFSLCQIKYNTKT